MDMIATKAMRYAGKDLQPGDPFEAASPRDFRTLRAISKARPAPEAEPEPDEDKPDEANPELNDQAQQAKPKAAAYKRRDVRAQA